MGGPCARRHAVLKRLAAVLARSPLPRCNMHKPARAAAMLFSSPRDWQQSAARVSTRSRASSAAVMAQQAHQQRPCPAPSAPPERSAGVRDAIPVGVINCALVASLCGPQMALLALRCRCSRGAARRARAAVLSQYAIATHSLWEGVHTFTGSRRDPMLVCDAVRSTTRW